MLAARQLTKRVGRQVILDEVDIAVSPGNITLLVGPSGAGKTTLLRCLAFIDRPDSGEIVFDHQRHLFPATSRQAGAPPWPDLTVVFQQHFLWPHLTIAENMKLPARKRPGGVSRFAELVELFDMQSYVDRYPNQTSLGQRQRAALARALILEPRVLLLDEITAALDVEQVANISELLLRLRTRGLGMLLITHQLTFARNLLRRGEGDRLAFMDRGKILESGGIEVLERPRHPRVREFLSRTELITSDLSASEGALAR
jgi:ABC-type polar amino acid transport system ATPase subunit